MYRYRYVNYMYVKKLKLKLKLTTNNKEDWSFKIKKYNHSRSKVFSRFSFFTFTAGICIIYQGTYMYQHTRGTGTSTVDPASTHPIHVLFCHFSFEVRCGVLCETRDNLKYKITNGLSQENTGCFACVNVPSTVQVPVKPFVEVR